MESLQQVSLYRLHDRGLVGCVVIMAEQMQGAVHREQCEFVDKGAIDLRRYFGTDHDVADDSWLVADCRLQTIDRKREHIGRPYGSRVMHVVLVEFGHLLDRDHC